MKYSDFISLQSYFLPVFDLQDGNKDYWEKFIPTKQFYELLEKALDAVGSNIVQNRKSVWVQGTFGTGKSHASAVIKHLLCDNSKNVVAYINDRIDNQNLKSRLMAFRKEKRFFPVVLKGIEGAYNPHTFVLTLERTVKEALTKAGHQISVLSDFEKAIEHIEEKTPYFKELIENPELRTMAKNKDEVLQKLKRSDIEFYQCLEKVLQQKYSVQLSVDDVAKWLSEVEKELKEQDLADGLLIFWDEFTSILDTIDNGSINLLQKIAELSVRQNIYLYLISHRNTMAYGVRADEIKKMQDRFHIVHYDMEALTTYHIMAATIKVDKQKKINPSYEELRTGKMDKFDKLISYLTDNTSRQSIEDVKNLFPLHPYTAFLCSSLASNIGSANRSVFNFLYDSQKGFRGFLQDENAYKNGGLLTADCLWDSFLDTFSNDSVKYGIITETYYTHIDTVSRQGLSYEKVFKGILLLNAMRNTFDKEQVLPSSRNIKYLFSYENFEKELDVILEYLDQNQIVKKDPSDNFLISFSSLPTREINEERKNAESKYKDILTILEFDPNHKQGIIKWFDERLIRCGEYCFLSCAADEHLVRSCLNKAFKQSYSLHIALFFAMNRGEWQAMTEMVYKLAQDDIFQNVIFVIFDECLNENTLQHQRFIDYVAMKTVATKHNANEQALTHQKNANQIVQNWLNRLWQGNNTIYFRTTKNPLAANNTADQINSNLISKIFSSGWEILQHPKQRVQTFYKQHNSHKSAEVMLCAIDRDDAEKKFSNGQYTPAKFLFKDANGDYVVEKDLQLKPGVSTVHPLVLIQNEVDNLLKKSKQQHLSSFNLGHVLAPLTEVPFGLFSNIPNVALLAFALRKYQKELYDFDHGVPITTDVLRDKVVDIFSYWQSGKNESKLRVRFGSKEEKELVDNLIAVFDLQNVPETSDLSSITNVRWGIMHYCKYKAKYPLWSLKYIEKPSAGVNKLIDQIIDMINKSDTQPEQIKQLLKSIKEYQHDLQRLLSRDGTFESGFRNFVKGIESVDIKKEWWGELLEYLSEHMAEEIGLWREDGVASKVKDFYIKEVKPTHPTNPKHPQPTTPLSQPATKASSDRVDEVINKVTRANLQTPALKWVLVQVLKHFPETAEVINDNLE